MSNEPAPKNHSGTPARVLLVSTAAMALLGFGIIAVVGALFTSTPWLPLQPMSVASSYLVFTVTGLVALLLLQAVSVNYVNRNRRATRVWGAVTLVVALAVALVFAFVRPNLGGSVMLGAPRLFWMVFGVVLLVAGGFLYQGGRANN